MDTITDSITYEKMERSIELLEFIVKEIFNDFEVDKNSTLKNRLIKCNNKFINDNVDNDETDKEIDEEENEEEGDYIKGKLLSSLKPSVKSSTKNNNDDEEEENDIISTSVPIISTSVSVPSLQIKFNDDDEEEENDNINYINDKLVSSLKPNDKSLKSINDNDDEEEENDINKFQLLNEPSKSVKIDNDDEEEENDNYINDKLISSLKVARVDNDENEEDEEEIIEGDNIDLVDFNEETVETYDDEEEDDTTNNQSKKIKKETVETYVDEEEDDTTNNQSKKIKKETNDDEEEEDDNGNNLQEQIENPSIYKRYQQYGKINYIMSSDVDSFLTKFYKLIQEENEKISVCNYIKQLVYKLQLFHYLFFKIGNNVMITHEQLIQGGEFTEEINKFEKKLTPHNIKTYANISKLAEEFNRLLIKNFKYINDITVFINTINTIGNIINNLYKIYVTIAHSKDKPYPVLDEELTFKGELENNISNISNPEILLEKLNKLNSELILEKTKQAKRIVVDNFFNRLLSIINSIKTKIEDLNTTQTQNKKILEKHKKISKILTPITPKAPPSAIDPPTPLHKAPHRAIAPTPYAHHEYTLLEFFKKLFLNDDDTIYDRLIIKNILTYNTSINDLLSDDKQNSSSSIVKNFNYSMFIESYQCDGNLQGGLFSGKNLSETEKKYNDDIKKKINTLELFKANIKDFFKFILSLKTLLTHNEQIKSNFTIDGEDKNFLFSIRQDYDSIENILNILKYILNIENLDSQKMFFLSNLIYYINDKIMFNKTLDRYVSVNELSDFNTTIQKDI